ncbi:MAG: DUF2891 domain-containing protein [Saprospiraceae bacterium]|nr:DUF2891 domain-containing protein [Saprospiraceae bacterium]
MKYLLLFLSFLPFSILAQNNPYLKKNDKGQLALTKAGASHFAKLALTCLQQEYPNKLNQVLPDSSMLQSPKVLHPAFYGCFDWHSSVHGHWMLIRLLKLFPNLPEGKEIKKKLYENLSTSNIAQEVAYFQQASKSWERMYGWAWLLKLSEELYTWNNRDAQTLYINLKPLTDAIIERYKTFLPLQHYPVRTGVHPNTAFGLSYAWDYANTVGLRDFQTLIEARAKDYFLDDTNCPAAWEPSGEDFLSACLEEANLMRRVLPKREFTIWLKTFLPDEQFKVFENPAEVSDRSDPKLVHLDGVNLSRAWCMYGLEPYVANEDLQKWILQAAQKHLEASVPFIASEYYEGTHWLASFAVYALTVSALE